MRVPSATVELIARRYINAAYIGLGHNRPVEERQFKSFFKLGPVGIAELWYALEETCGGCVYSDGAGQVLPFTSVGVEHLLLCLHFMKTYDSVSCGASLFSMSKKTYRKYFWAMVSYLGHLAQCTVSTSVSTIFLLCKNTFYSYLCTFWYRFSWPTDS